jgi:radical SAM family RiPP maturation amino acid epimerase
MGYQKVLDSFSTSELSKISQVKRLFEWVEGDLEFRKHFETGKFSDEELKRLKKIGIVFDVNEIAILWKEPQVVDKMNMAVRDFDDAEKHREVLKKLKNYPLLELWVKFQLLKNRYCYKNRERNISVPLIPRFDKWRKRRISSAKSELGHFGNHIDHPLFAFELGDGCSIGCWFCAFSSRKLTKNFSYKKNRDIFNAIIQKSIDMFGKKEATQALLYHGTEPHDNPGYIEFLKDHAQLTEYSTCTATAVSTDAKWLRSLIDFYRQGNYPWPRLSILSKSVLLKVHDLYTPDELRDVSLLMQMREHPRPKVSGGRILKEEAGLRAPKQKEYVDNIVPQGTIACVSGFLVNLVEQTIKLISPCYKSSKWPYGYRIFDELTFELNAEAFGRTLEKLITKNMPENFPINQIVRLRDDLVFKSTEEGFNLISPNQVHHCNSKDIYKPLGSFLQHGKYTLKELCGLLSEEYKFSFELTTGLITKFFKKGLLDEVYYNE